jgi:type II secretory pathway pseudopilin PulG
VPSPAKDKKYTWKNKTTNNTMKLTNTRIMNHKTGMTLLELTVVILVLLSLISILFIGARAWKKGSDRAGCIIQIRNVQQGIRSFANMNGLNPGDAVPGGSWHALVIGPGLFVEREPLCAAGGVYAPAADGVIPAIGTLGIVCSMAGSPDLHTPKAADMAGW